METSPNTEKMAKPELRSVPLARTNISVRQTLSDKPASSSTPRQGSNKSRHGVVASMIRILSAALTKYIEESKLWLSKIVEIAKDPPVQEKKIILHKYFTI